MKWKSIVKGLLQNGPFSMQIDYLPDSINFLAVLRYLDSFQRFGINVADIWMEGLHGYRGDLTDHKRGIF